MYRLNAAQPFIKGFQVTCAVGVPGCSLDIACNDTSTIGSCHSHVLGD